MVLNFGRSSSGKFSSGFIIEPNTFFEVLEPQGAVRRQPVVMIHGGGHTGSCYLVTADGRPGWAHVFAARGYKVVVPDWPGTGRSGYVPYESLTSDVVIAGLGKVLATLGTPAIVMTHSMSGPFGWKLLELFGDRIASLVAIAPGGPGNLRGPAEILAETPEYVETRLVPEAPVARLSRSKPFVAEREWAFRKMIGNSTRFPKDCVDAYLASLIVVPPRLILERFNVGNGNSAPRVADFTHFKDKRVALVVGTDDVDHPESLDKPIVDWLNQNGANAEFIALEARGIKGNGHMMMMESNSDQIAAGIIAWLEKGSFPKA